LKTKFSEDVADIVQELTNNPNTVISKDDYLIAKINSITDDAIIIKLADRLDNLLDKPNPNTITRTVKMLNKSIRLKTTTNEYIKRYVDMIQSTLLNPRIEFVPQRHKSSCMIASNAMIHGLTHEQILDYYDYYCKNIDDNHKVQDVIDGPGASDDFTCWLAKKLDTQYVVYKMDELSKERLSTMLYFVNIVGPAIVTMNSLNVPNGLHAVVIDSEMNVYDPQFGKSSKKAYTGKLTKEDLIYNFDGALSVKVIDFGV
jgi:hypothetical protein